MRKFVPVGDVLFVMIDVVIVISAIIAADDGDEDDAASPIEP
jgi:hypothetical protein